MILIKNAKVVAPDSRYHNKKIDILIKNGQIAELGKNIKAPKAKEIQHKNLHVSIGWLDIGAQLGDPGFEHREDWASASAAAAAGGYTGLACFPNTDPVIHSKSEVLYLKNTASPSLVDVFPIGAVSKNCEGEDLTEMIDMKHAGAVAFSDGKKPIQNSGMMMRALQYVRAIDGLIINHPQDDFIAGNGQMHEGDVSTSLGMKGIAVLAEDLMVQRDIYLADYTDSKVHLSNISTANAVDLIRKAKAKGVQVTASVPAINLVFDDTKLSEFDSNFKTLPPLRPKSDIKALLKGVIDGTIDIISTNHVPLEEEVKLLEFPYAKFGIIGLQTSFAICNTFLKTLKLEVLINRIAMRPREILNLEIPKIEKGAIANLCFFDPTLKWTYQKSDILSKSKNCPFIGQEFKGKVIGVINRKKASWFI